MSRRSRWCVVAGQISGLALLVTVLAAAESPARAAELRSAELRGAGGQALCLDVPGGNTASGTDLILYGCHGGANQRFTFDRDSGVIKSALGDVCVDIPGAAAWAGQRVELWSCNGSGAQQFTYDPRTRRLMFRGNPGLCLDAGTPAAPAHLWDCNEAPSQRFLVTTPYGNRRFDELTFLAAHNAFNNYEDSRWAAPNQSRGIGHALRDGVRGLLLDIHSFESGTARCILSFGSDCYGRDVYMCHGDCGGVPGINYALPRQTLSGALRTVVDYLNENPDELVTVFLE